MSELTYKQGLGKLRRILEAHQTRTEDWKTSNANRDEVLARFQPIFDPENLPTLTIEDFNSFLPLENNKHWGPCHLACDNGPRVRAQRGPAIRG